MTDKIIKLAFAYLIGSIPFSVFFSKYVLNKDIRKFGSGNIGTSNAYRVGGPFFSFIVALLDIGKAFFVVKYILAGNISILAVCLGQMYPIFLKLDGGKGMGCYLGAVLTNYPFSGILLIIIWLVSVFITKIPTLATIIVLIVSMFLLKLDLYLIATFLLIIFKHKDNIIKLFEKYRKIINKL